MVRSKAMSPRPISRTRPRTAFVVAIAICLLVGCGGDDHSSSGREVTPLLVGTAQRPITPTTPVYLGGYGLGPERRSTGVLAPIHVRAMVISDGQRTVAFAENETQGAFAAYKRGAYGLIDIEAAVAQATGGQIPRENVIVGSDHSHSGPDTTGIWGGLPADYWAYLKDQTVAVIVDAFNARQPAALYT